ncbi:hypothetical protein KKB55_20735 [Myxococcota bacterium]|nr:hypothetical protein [Myxococcota bacterium]MBU1900176.1 hypothetical protein [Myxococcota bacterium]
MNEVQLWRGKVEDLGRRVRALLIKDAAVYFQKAVREAVAASPARISACDRAALKALKAQTQAAEAQAIAALEAALTDAVFLEEGVGGESIKSLPRVAEALNGLEAAARACLKAGDLTETEAARYRLPVRFIDGEDLVTLTRALYKARRQLAAATASAAVEEAQAVQSEALKRWDDL